MDQPPKRPSGWWLFVVLALVAAVTYGVARTTSSARAASNAVGATYQAAAPSALPTPTAPIDSGQNTSDAGNGPANDRLSNDEHYTNVDGDHVHSPAYSADGSEPAGATAQCQDGTYSFSEHRQGTCSHHGGVAQWL
jgi:hypothetical protein